MKSDCYGIAARRSWPTAEAARAFARVGAHLGGKRLSRAGAEETARAMAPLAAGQGPLAAYYVLAMRESVGPLLRLGAVPRPVVCVSPRPVIHSVV